MSVKSHIIVPYKWKFIILFLNLNCLFALKVCQDLKKKKNKHLYIYFF